MGVSAVAIALKVGGVIAGLTAGAAALVTVLVFAFGPDLAGQCADRSIAASAAQGAAVQQQIDQFTDALDAGDAATLVLTENDLTSRALLWIEEHNAPFAETQICMFGPDDDRPGAFELRGKVDIPVVPDRVVRVRGSVDVSGPSPVADLQDVDLGSLGFLIDTLGVTGAIESAINNELEDVPLPHRYTLAVEEGRLILEGTP